MSYRSRMTRRIFAKSGRIRLSGIASVSVTEHCARTEDEDDSLSFIHASRISPPGFAVDFIDYICQRKNINIHSSRAQLYLSAPKSRSVYASYSARHGTWKTLDDPTLMLADPGAPVLLSERAGTREHPSVLYLDLDPSMDRVHAAVPVGLGSWKGLEGGLRRS